MDFQKFSTEYATKKREQDILRRKVNENAYALAQPVEQKYKQLVERRNTLEVDKISLIKSMEELDQKRTDALAKCFKEVNVNLSQIFSQVLPGSSAQMQEIKLFPGTPKEAQGVEISVCFSGIWKESLFELSGGQRSLLALSFLFANLRCRPAPFYILDEIDSALDLSHTENIGAIISAQFPQSQFILVSLKEGMYNNANNLYKVSFVDGTSKVERYIQKLNKGKSAATSKKNKEKPPIQK